MKKSKTAGEILSFSDIEARKKNCMSAIFEDFLGYARFELNYSPQTIIKYRDSLKCFVRDVGDKPVETLDVLDFVKLKKVVLHS